MYLTEDIYNLVVESVPIICVDVVPIKFDKKNVQLGTILRKTGPEAGKITLIGGRIMKNETINQAIKRTIYYDLSIRNYKFYNSFSESKPLLVQQYAHNTTSTPKDHASYDPTKHAIGLTYPIIIDETPIPKNEASNYLWITENDLSKKFGYDHQKVLKKFFGYFNKLK